jgi:beta-lactam-binding protein with PASTA domain
LGLAVATTKLRIHHCARGTVKRHYSTRRAGVVLSQDPEAGSDLANGTAVNLVESRGRRHKHG